MDASTIRTTCPRDCYDACGILVKRSDGGPARVVGDPEHGLSSGALCGKCSIAYNGVWRDPSVRLTRPLKRVGPKGAGQFEAVSWDDALGAIADRLNAIRAEKGGASILQTHYTGTCSLIAGVFPLRLFNRIGATEVDPDTVCNKAGHAALQLMYGRIDARLRPAHDRRRKVPDDLGRQSFGLGAACARALVHEGAGTAHRGRSHSPRDGGRGRHPPAALSRHGRRARVRDAQRDPQGGSHRPRLPRRADARLGGDRGHDRCLHAAMGRGDDRCPGAAHRGGGAPLRQGAVTPLDGTRLSTPVLRRQRHARGGAAPGGNRQHRQVRRGLSLSQRLGHARRRCRLSRGLAPQSGARAFDQPHGSREPARAARNPGAHHLEQQHRRLEPRAAPPAARARARGPFPGHARPVPDQHGRLRRLRASGVGLPRVRRRRDVVLQLFDLGPGAG